MAIVVGALILGVICAIAAALVFREALRMQERAPLAVFDPDDAYEFVVAHLDDVVAAWPEVLAAMKAPVRAAISVAQPVAVEDGDVVVFGVPEPEFRATNDRFRKEAEAVKAALG